MVGSLALALLLVRGQNWLFCAPAWRIWQRRCCWC